MKSIKKTIAIVLAMAMVLGMSLFVHAADEGGTVENKTTHTYDVYQVFSGTQAEGDPALGDIEWGSGIDANAFLDALKADDRFGKGENNAFKEAATAAAVADALKTHEDNTPFAKAFANVAADHIKPAKKTATVTGKTVSPKLPSGYYLFYDSTVLGEDSTDALNSAILQITNKDITIEKKYTTPEIDKEIFEEHLKPYNFEAIDKSIGDTVTYTLTATFPNDGEFNFDDYETYKLVFHDELAKGQAFNKNTIKVELHNGSAAPVDLTEFFDVTLTENSGNPHDGSTAAKFTVGNDNILALRNEDAGRVFNKSSSIVVTYSVTITEDSVVGKAGNKNSSWLEFSNNPNSEQGGTSKTKPDETFVFTYELDTTKVAGEAGNQKLKGAQFILKATGGTHSGKYVQVDAATGKLTGWLDIAPKAVETPPTTGNTGVLVSGTDGLFKVIGLDSGTYELTEVKAPAGYNLLADPIQIDILATIEAAEGQEPELKALNIRVNNEELPSEPDDYSESGKLPLTVVNNKGTSLPSTGGMGTTILYIIGAVLIVGAGVVLVTRKRMHG